MDTSGAGDAGTVSVRLLGPFAVTVGGTPVALSSRLRTLLAVLALDVGRPVPAERIAAAVWGDGRPADTRKAIQVLVARLRAVLGSAAIRTTADGYQLGIPPDAVDLHRFESTLARSRAAPDAAGEYRLLRVALTHWGGSPFEAVDSDLLLAVDRPRLLDLVLHAVERCADIALAGHVPEPGDLAADLRELVGAHPLREGLWVRLMAVLDRTGRRADALAAYQDLYRVLREELGTQPGQEAQAVHRRLLADEADGADGVDGANGRRLTTSGPPSTLPPSDPLFGGRTDALASLDALMDALPEPGAAPRAARIAVVDGPGGIGKTTTVLHWARRVAGRFPDGSLYVDLRGFSPTDTPLAPEAAVRRFLDALRVPPGRIPADADAQAALYRSVLADRRVLVVLDNARSVEQVRPLLPGGRHCVVVVTSRNRLGGLVAMEGATRVTLGTLTPSEARDVLAARLGAARLAAEPGAADELLALCGGLPLAHVIVAERAAARPDARLADLVGELRHGSRIDALSADGDRAARSVFSWSYRALGADAARVFRLLGLQPGPHVTVPGVASLAALPERRARAAVAELERASLLTEPAPGRFAVHELLLDYAIELAGDDPPADIESATVRMLDHYLRAAHQAEEMLAPMEDPHTVGPPPDGVAGMPPPADYNSAVEVFESETPVFVAMVRRAAGTGNDEYTWRIARCLRTYLWGRGLVSTAFEVERLALAALESLGRVPEQVASRCWIVHALMRFGRFDDAWQMIAPTLALAERFANDGAHAWALHAMGVVLAERGRPDEALVHARRALELFRRAGDRVGEGRVQPAAAFYLLLLGRHADALDAARRAFAIETETGDLLIRGHTRELIGDIQRDRGEHRAAVESFRAAVDDWRPIRRDVSLADALDKLGDAYEAAGDPDRASTARREARSVRDELAPAPVAR